MFDALMSIARAGARMPPSRRHGRVARPARPHLTGTAAILAAAYGNSTFTLKNLWAELVGDCHTASVRFVLPKRTLLSFLN